MGSIISVAEICRARDRRILQLEKLRSAKATGYILLTLNIPGDIKNSSIYRQIFVQGVRELKILFEKFGIDYKTECLLNLITGPEFYVSFYGIAPGNLKLSTIEIEEKHILGRIFDIDVFDADLNQVKKDGRRRSCFICGRPGIECARSRRHGIVEVLGEINRRARDFFNSIFWNIAAIATRAMLSEVLTTPKPGLVDRAGSGSHFDMDVFSFVDSSTALTRTFYKIARLGADFDGEDFEAFAESLREAGIEGEKVMFKATGGVNTQKGLIYSLGLLSAAAGHLICNDSRLFSGKRVCQLGGEIATAVSAYDFENCLRLHSEERTVGEKIFNEYGIKGARGEAMKGFPNAYRALEILKDNLANGYDRNKAFAGTFMAIAGEVDDTNVIGRGGLKALEYVRKQVTDFIDSGGIYSTDWRNKLEAIDRKFQQKNISPGGSADILAISIFIFYLEKEYADSVFLKSALS